MTLSAAPVAATSIPTTELHVWQARIDSKEAARWALRTVLGRYLVLQPEEVELRLGPHGKPALAAPGSSLRFNLSHSADEALIVVAWEREVGVDIEQIRPRGDLLGLARRALERGEARAIAAMPAAERADAFHAAWTRREAIAKCLGVGLTGPLPEDDVAVSAFDAGPGFAAAVAVTGREALPLRRLEVGSDLSPSGAG